MNMKISIVIPVYNVQEYLQECVSSVLMQTYQDIEIILVDDGSTDDSGHLCDQLLKQDNRIAVVHQVNQGLSVARNVGLKHASGNYVLFLDSDDYYADSQVISVLADKLLQFNYPDTLLFCRVDYYQSINKTFCEQPYNETILNAKKTPIECFDYLLHKQRFNMSACFQIIKRSTLVNNNIEFIKGIRNEDIDWSIQLWRCLRNVKVVNLYAYVYRHRGNSITTTLSLHDYRSYDIMLSKWREILDPMKFDDVVFLQYLAYIYPTMVYGYFQIPYNQRHETYSILQKHHPLLDFSVTRKSDRLIRLGRFLGFRASVYVLSLYSVYLKPLIRRLRK